MPFELPDGPPITPEKMRKTLEESPMTKEIVAQIFEDGVVILFTKLTMFQASVIRARRNGKIVLDSWIIRVNPTKAETREKKKYQFYMN